MGGLRASFIAEKGLCSPAGTVVLRLPGTLVHDEIRTPIPLDSELAPVFYNFRYRDW